MWSGSAITSRTRQQVWELDLIGNWVADQVDLNGDNDFVDAGEHNASNTFNAVNEQTARGGASPVYDEVGNLTDNDEDQKYVYDAWGRLVEVRNQSSALISRHRYKLGGRAGVPDRVAARPRCRWHGGDQQLEPRSLAVSRPRHLLEGGCDGVRGG